MKKTFLLLLVVSSTMCGCLKDTIYTETTYTGCVKSMQNNPISNVKIAVAQSATYSNVVCITFTDAMGNFKFKLNGNRFNGTNTYEKYYLFFDINGQVRAQTPLQGIGEEAYDYGTIIIN